MSKQLQSVPLTKAHLIMAGASFTVQAADPSDQQANQRGPGFEMVLYTGSVFAGHWYWGDVILDVTGFKQHRQDIPALWAHYGGSVGFTTSITADPAAATIVAKGQLIAGTDDQEPEANRVRRRLDQKAPLQCSGRWIPSRVEKVLAGAKATVNGKTVQGPVSIFRQFHCAEASFVDLGWDPMTNAVAASDSASRSVQVEVQGAKPESKPMPNSIELIAALKPILGADKAIELVTAKPEAADLAAFSPEIIAHAQTLTTQVKDLNAQLGAKDAEIGSLKTDLATAKARPPVISAAGSSPTPPAAQGAPKTEDQLKAEYAGSKDLQAEYGSVEVFLHAKTREQERGA